jgi:hypothetical protein
MGWAIAAIKTVAKRRQELRYAERITNIDLHRG